MILISQNNIKRQVGSERQSFFNLAEVNALINEYKRSLHVEELEHGEDENEEDETTDQETGKDVRGEHQLNSWEIILKVGSVADGGVISQDSCTSLLEAYELLL